MLPLEDGLSKLLGPGCSVRRGREGMGGGDWKATGRWNRGAAACSPDTTPREVGDPTRPAH